MLVTAKCVERCWDSTRCIMYQPGETVELDSSSPLAALKIDQGSGQPATYVFQYPRLAAIAAAVAGKNA